MNKPRSEDLIAVFRSTEEMADTADKFDMFKYFNNRQMSIIHSIAANASVEVAFDLIKTIKVNETFSGQSNNASQIIITKLYLLSSSEDVQCCDKVSEVLEDIPSDLDLNTSPFKCCQNILWGKGDSYGKESNWQSAIAWSLCLISGIEVPRS
jgi:Meiosis protein SPO22/ZIP4 like